MCLAVPGKIVQTHDDRGIRMAMVDFDGIRKEICLAYVPETGVGDYVIVHAGFAISQLDETSALQTLAMLKELGLVEPEIDGMGPHGDEANIAEAPDRS